MRLDLIRWETHAYPGFDVDAQAVINKQIPSDYDVFIGIMWHRFGTPTGRANSGTEEEFLTAKRKWDADSTSLNMLLYFKEAQVSLNQIDPNQLSKLNEFRKSLPEQGGLYWSFQTTDDFVNLLRMHLTRVMQEWKEKLSASTIKPAEKIRESQLAVITNDEKFISTINEDEEIGLIELVEDVGNKFAEVDEVSRRIAKATETLGKKIAEGVSRIKNTSEPGQPNIARVKRMMSKAADEMNNYAATLALDVPLLRGSLQDGFGYTSQAISLWPEFFKGQESIDQATNLMFAVSGLREVLFNTGASMQSLLDNVSGLPRLTVNLNKAKRALKIELQALVDLFLSQEQLLVQTELSIKNLLTDLNQNGEKE